MENKEETTTSQKLKIPKIDFPKGIFTFYLSHPASSRHYVRKWELEFERKHPNIALLNPFYDTKGGEKEDVKARDEGREFEKYPGFEWELTQRDYIAIAFSRGILGVVDENADSSIGTLMEFVFARVMAKNPKLCVCTNKKLINHPWLKTFFHKIYPSFEALEADIVNQVDRVKAKWGF